jgi:glycerophosphoryl diester phosphodiesterase
MRATIVLCFILAQLAILPLQATAASPETAAVESHPYFNEPLLLGAHRGGRAIFPENTAYAFKAAAERWPEILLEGDLHVSKDGHLVMIHDSTVDRTTDGSGAVADLTLAELQALDAAYHFQPPGAEGFPLRGKGIRIPTLQEALAAAPNHRFLVEMKGGVGVAEKVAAAVREAGAMDRFMVASFTPAYMNALRETAPEMLTCFDPASGMMLLSALRRDTWKEYRPEAQMLTLSPGILNRMALTSEELDALQSKGIVVQLHTINRAEDMRQYLEMGVDSILTDYPDRLTEIIKEKSPATTTP